MYKRQPYTFENDGTSFGGRKPRPARSFEVKVAEDGTMTILETTNADTPKLNSKMCIRDRSYDKGLYAALREDPDVILIGEMRDPATIETALMAAETGHLVFSTIHTNSAIDSIDRIVGVFPEDKQPQIRMQLSMTLRAVLSQQLVPRAGGQGRAAACELMMLTPAIRNLIRDGKTRCV